ncbi:MAG TPA: cytochrome P450 [Pyrinomonadaceae bacterium]
MQSEISFPQPTPQLLTPPTPKGHWFFGSGPEAAANPLKFYCRVWQELGDVVKMRTIFGIEWYLIANPAGAEQVLQTNQANYKKPALFTKALGMIAGNGLVTSEGDFWRRQRRLAQPAFHRQRLALLSETMTSAATETVENWKNTFARTGEAFDVSEEMTKLTVRIAAGTLFSADISEDAERFGVALKIALNHVSHRMRYPFAPPEFVPTKRNREFNRARKTLDEIVMKIIRRRRIETEDKGDLLSMLIEARDEETGEMMSDRQLKDEVMTLLIAGHETTAAGLSWSWYLLAKNDCARARLRAELELNLQGKAPTVEDLPRLPFTRMVFEETMRLFPPAWGQPRQSIGADEIGGFRIDAGKMLVVSQYIVHRHPQFWQRPEDFCPERFTPENSKNRPRFAYFPFGGGARQCIGNHFAMMEAQIVLATIAQNFLPQPVETNQPELDPTFALRPKNGLPMRLA